MLPADAPAAVGVEGGVAVGVVLADLGGAADADGARRAVTHQATLALVHHLCGGSSGSLKGKTVHNINHICWQCFSCSG